MDANEVSLKPIDQSNWRDALTIQAAEGQLRFLADHEPVALVILAKTAVGAGGWRWEPLAFVVGDEQGGADMVGVAALAHDGATTRLFHLLIDRRRQSQGLGSRAVAAIVDHCSAFGTDRLELTVHPDNHVAQHLYAKVGFAPTGEMSFDEPVWTKSL